MENISFEIQSQWNGSPIDHSPVKITIKKGEKDSVLVEVDAPFFDDQAPSGKPGHPFPQLWDYEVVEVFFLGKDDKYLEVELSPHGQHLVLLLNGMRNMIKDELSLEYNSSIDRVAKRWTGKAVIPSCYFPTSVNKINAYAIHGDEDSRVYEALYPAPAGKHEQPDFHRLEYFQEISLTDFLPSNKEDSEVWKQFL